MKNLMAASLVILGVIWIHYTSLDAKATRLGAMNDAAKIESDLHAFLSTRLNDDDMNNLFPNGDQLRLGGWNPDITFRKRISEISASVSLPLYPGILATFIGLVGLFVTKTQKRIREAEVGASNGG